MSSPAPIDITVVYDASGKRRVTLAPKRAARPDRGRRPQRVPRSAGPGGGRAALLVVSVVNLLVGAALCYATWWHVDRGFLLEALVLRTPLDVDVEAAAAQMFQGLTEDYPGFFVQQRPRQPAETTEDAAPEAGEPALPAPEPATSLIRGRAARNVIGATAYAWLTLATLAVCALGLAGGAGLTTDGPRRRVVRIVAAASAVALAAGLAWSAYNVWTTYGFEYPTGKTRAGIAGIAVLSVLIGLAAGGSPRRWNRIAAAVLLISAVASVVGLCLGALSGAVEPPYSTAPVIGLVFVVHSLWAWILLFLGRRVLR